MQAKPALGLLSYIPQPKAESPVTPFSLNVGSTINMGQFFLASQGTALRHIRPKSLRKACLVPAAVSTEQTGWEGAILPHSSLYVWWLRGNSRKNVTFKCPCYC